MARTRTHYDVIGVSPHAEHDEIRRAYRRLAQQHHPDANPGPAAAAAMAEINAAWDVLGDPAKRESYDWAIGTTPRPRANGSNRVAPDPDPELFEPDPPVKSRPSDVLVAIPVLLFLLAVATFFFSVMTESDSLRTAALLLVPVSVGAFIAAPLFVMLRARRRDG